MTRRKLTAALAMLLALGGCTSSHRASPRGRLSPTPPPSPASGSLLILAASTLKPAFDPIDLAFQAAYPGVSITVTYQGSQSLATAILAGAQADLFASTDPAAMSALTGTADSPVTGTAVTFARNDLEIALPIGNPKGIQTLPDLARPGSSVVLANPSLPEGRDAATSLTIAGVKPPSTSLQSSVALVLTTLLSGSADASILYRSDVANAGPNVTGAAIPAPADVVVSYSIAVLRNGTNPAAAQAFVRFVVSGPGRALLTGAGFLPP